jgi:hypothetical protein
MIAGTAFQIRLLMNWSSWGFGMPTNAAISMPRVFVIGLGIRHFGCDDPITLELSAVPR